MNGFLFDEAEFRVEAKKAPPKHDWWSGNSRSVWSCIGASSHSASEREVNDFYATDPAAVDFLLEKFAFPTKRVLEPSAGQGHISERLKDWGYDVESYDLIDRGYCPCKNFFDIGKFDGSVCTNPPYKHALEFCHHALEIIPEGQCVAMFLKLTFLEGVAHRAFFDESPFKTLYVSSGRIVCAKNADFAAMEKVGSAQAYGWYVWQKGWHGKPQIEWIN